MTSSGAPIITRREALITFTSATASTCKGQAQTATPRVDLPDPLLVETYEAAADRNVLASVNPKVFPGYFSVCADGRGFGYGNTYPSLDGHQLTDALLWLGDAKTALLNWDYVRKFQREDGLLPIAILPESAGKLIGPGPGFQSQVAGNGGLYRHWTPGNPLEALASTTYIQNADVLFRATADLDWLKSHIESIELAAGYLASLTNKDGAVRGAGYYVERPVRLDRDGVTQPHAADAFLRAAALCRIAGRPAQAANYTELAARIRRNFQKSFWINDHFAEYIHPSRGLVDLHGLSDSNWAALAFAGMATPSQQQAVWPRLQAATADFHYGGMPTGIATRPTAYQDWEFTFKDRMDLAAMGRVWHLEAAARARMGDAEGLLDGLRKVAQTGRDSGFYWRERYTASGPHGAQKYCEYPANFIRIIQRFLLGVDLRLDGSIALRPVATPAFWARGFGQRLSYRNGRRRLEYRMRRSEIHGKYEGDRPQRLHVFSRTLQLEPGAEFHAKA